MAESWCLGHTPWPASHTVQPESEVVHGFAASEPVPHCWEQVRGQRPPAWRLSPPGGELWHMVRPSMPRALLPPAPTLAPDEARAWLVSHLGLATPRFPSGAEGTRALLTALRCIQLDPLDVIGTNADLVALARVEGLSRGDVYQHLMPGHAFEHWAKERCLLPAYAFPYYRERTRETPWWHLATRLERLPSRVLQAVLEEVAARGPISAAELTDHGAVKPLDWNGWKGTGKATSMALEVLWTRCQVVVCGRGPGGKRYDVPERALPHTARAPLASG